MDKLVTGAKENPVFPDFLAGDRLLMMVVARWWRGLISRI
jgi:hypothetical protein